MKTTQLISLIAAVALLPALVSCGSSKKKADDAKPEYKVVAYYPSFRGDGAVIPVSRLSKVTHVNLSFAILDGEGNLDDARVRRSHAQLIDSLKLAGCKVLVSVGGGGGPVVQKNFATVICDSAARARAEDNLMTMVSDLSLDGLDIDYEAWGVAGFDNETLAAALEVFLAELRERLGEERLLTAAVADYGLYTPAMAQYFDYITVMAYDLTGPWRPEIAGPHSPFEFYESAIQKFVDMGYPGEKIVGGVPFYGYGFRKDGTAYSMTYAQIVEEFPGAEHLDCINGELFYDGMPTMKKKCDYVKENGLGGIMFWQIHGDTPDPAKSLLDLIHTTLSE